VGGVCIAARGASRTFIMVSVISATSTASGAAILAWFVFLLILFDIVLLVLLEMVLLWLLLLSLVELSDCGGNCKGHFEEVREIFGILWMVFIGWSLLVGLLKPHVLNLASIFLLLKLNKIFK
jgi:hypothetical protein